MHDPPHPMLPGLNDHHLRVDIVVGQQSHELALAKWMSSKDKTSMAY
jgi:hypothetical protein